MILEYKLEMSYEGMRTPSWVDNGGYFYNPIDKTFVGYTPDEADRDYYVPDTVVQLTRDELILRVDSLGLTTPDGIAVNATEEVDNFILTTGA